MSVWVWSWRNMTLPHRKVMEGNHDLQVSLSVIVRTFVKQTYKGKWIIKYTPIRTRIKLSWLRVQFYHWRLAWKACSMRFYHKSIKEQYKNNNSRIKSLLRIQIQLRLQMMIFLLSEMILSILNIWLNLISLVICLVTGSLSWFSDITMILMVMTPVVNSED